MPLAPRLVLYLAVLFIVWGALLQYFVSRNTAAADAQIAKFRAELEAMNSDATVADASEGAVETLVLTEWRVAKDKIRAAMKPLKEQVTRLHRSLDELEQAKSEAAESLQQAQAELDAAHHPKKASNHVTQTGLAAIDLTLVDQIIEHQHYGANAEGRELHTAMLKVGAKAAKLVEMQCLLENWREFLDPFIKAVEKRADRMLYNYI